MAPRSKRTKPPTSGDPLTPYRGKRDFTRTPEPAGAARASSSSTSARFVVQRHRASRLHYDLRFEVDGVLVSWAVPKGPTLDPRARRMAVHVEDHPIEYIDFEGVIPAKEYGGGDVIVWDRGTWEPHMTDDPASAVAAGELHAEVFGDKLRGKLVLVRRGDDDDKQWLLLHKRDEHAVDGWDPEAHPHSVLSGRTNEEVAADPDRLWHSELPASRAAETLRATGPSESELSALSELGGNGSWEVHGRTLRVTNLDKELFPARRAREKAVTKRELVAYAACIAPVALPYLRGRAMNLHRYPNGTGSKGFWHKQLPKHAPDWIPRWDDPEAGGDTTTYLVADEPAALVWAANFGALEWHAWTSRTDEPRAPTYALIDLDPGEQTSWADVLTLARLHRAALEHLGVRAQAKLTGRRGIQIWVPIARGPGFDATRDWVKRLSQAVGTVVPELVSWKWAVRERGGLARLDYTQNAINKTLVAPYSPRAAAGAPVSAPIAWDELDDDALRPDGFTIRTVIDRLAERGDPFRDLLDVDQTLPAIALP